MKTILPAFGFVLGSMMFATMPAQGAFVSATVEAPSGVRVTTAVDATLGRIRYTVDGLDPAILGEDYEQIALKQPEIPLAVIDGPYGSLTWTGSHYVNIDGSMYAPGASGWVWDAFDVLTLELQYQQAQPPGPQAVFGYDYRPEFRFTGNFLAPAGEGNLTVSLRDGSELVFTAYLPELAAVPEPRAALLFLAGLLGTAGVVGAGRGMGGALR